MAEISFFDRIKTIFEMIFSSTFFISLFVIIILTIIVLIVNSKVNSKIPKYCTIAGYLIIIIFTLYKYGSYIFSINDSVVEEFFSAIYFPNLVVYIAMLIITLLLLTITFINKNYSRITKIGNIFSFSLIWLLFVLILDVVKTNEINVYDITEVYSNSTLLILLQASMYIFIIWIGILLMNLAVRKISQKLDIKDLTTPISKSVLEIENEEEVRDYTDEEFQAGFLNNINKDKEKKYLEILEHKDFDI